MNAMKQKLSEDFQSLDTCAFEEFSCSLSQLPLPHVGSSPLECSLESQVDMGYWQHCEMTSAYLRTSSLRMPLYLGMKIQRLDFRYCVSDRADVKCSFHSKNFW
jgi:hypothetical protein